MTPTEALFNGWIRNQDMFLVVFTDFTVIAVEQRSQENTYIFLKLSEK